MNRIGYPVETALSTYIVFGGCVVSSVLLAMRVAFLAIGLA